MSEFDINEFWQRIKYLCRIKRMSQKNLAAAIDMTEQTICRQIARMAIPSTKQSVKMAEALGVSVEFLITGTELDSFKNENTRLKDIIHDVHKIAVDN